MDLQGRSPIRRGDFMPGYEFREGGAVGLGGFGSGVKVKFARAVGELPEVSGDDRGGHASAFAQTENAVGKLHAVLFQMRKRGAAEVLENPRHGCKRAGFADETHGAETVPERDGQCEAEDRGMQVQVRVTVPVGGRKTECAEALELRCDLAPQRPGECGRKRVAEPGACGRGGEVSPRIRERGDLRRAARAEREMQAHAQGGIAPRDLHRVRGGGLIDHQAGLRDEARAVAALDGGVDLRAAAEVVGGDDEVFQFAGRTGRLGRAAMTIRPMSPTTRKV